jgi:hypothetical protein
LDICFDTKTFCRAGKFCTVFSDNKTMDSSCAGSQAGRGRVLRADIAGAAAAYSTKTENDLHARRTSFICLSTPTLTKRLA